MRPFEPNQENLELISRAGYAANAHSDGFRELIVDLRAETDDPLVLAVRSAWNTGTDRQAPLPTETVTGIKLKKTFDNPNLQVLLQDGLAPFVEDLQSINGVTDAYLRSLTEAYLASKGITADNGKVIVRHAGLGIVDFDGDVYADDLFDNYGLARPVAVVAQKSSTGKQG